LKGFSTKKAGQKSRTLPNCGGAGGKARGKLEHRDAKGLITRRDEKRTDEEERNLMVNRNRESER